MAPPPAADPRRRRPGNGYGPTFTLKADCTKKKTLRLKLSTVNASVYKE
jgi:hypothetical protein